MGFHSPSPQKRVHGGPDVVDSLAHVRASKLLPRVEEILVIGYHIDSIHQQLVKDVPGYETDKDDSLVEYWLGANS
uniref:Uncharacterized protein n=1 Tax=Timema monikensis TaxID=170555 RepID=A0A7R9ED85_9NEOP|nr:unnamed protein product [Timema monikensis]